MNKKPLITGIILIVIGALDFNITPGLIEDCKSFTITKDNLFKKETPPQCYLAQSANLLNTTIGLDAIKLMMARALMSVFIGLGLVAYGIVVRAPPKKEKAKPVSQQQNSPSVAIDILNARLARGEITKEEYDEMKKRMSDKSSTESES